MPKKTDSKQRMISAARRLFREHGYHGTALSEVITESAAPRGSLYFHFPGGKEELATEVALLHAAEAIAHVNRVAGATDTPAELIAGFMGRFRDELVASDYREGCAMAPIVIETTPSSAPLSDVSRRAFADVIAVLAARLTDKDVPSDRATVLATNTVTAMEGALILARVLRNTEPFDGAIATLSASAAAVVAH
ncbi:MAG: TetR/AcrR family transcriptional regulator [Mycobacterium sp.]